MHARLFFHLVKMIQDLENAKYKKSTREHVQQCHTDATARPPSAVQTKHLLHFSTSLRMTSSLIGFGKAFQSQLQFTRLFIFKPLNPRSLPFFSHHLQIRPGGRDPKEKKERTTCLSRQCDCLTCNTTRLNACSNAV